MNNSFQQFSENFISLCFDFYGNYAYSCLSRSINIYILVCDIIIIGKSCAVLLTRLLLPGSGAMSLLQRSLTIWEGGEGGGLRRGGGATRVELKWAKPVEKWLQLNDLEYLNIEEWTATWRETRMRTFTDQHCQAGIWSVSVSRRTLAPGEQGRNNNNSSNTLSVETNGESD